MAANRLVKASRPVLVPMTAIAGVAGLVPVALSLVEYVRSRGLVEELLRVGSELRPDIPWEVIGT